MTAFNRAFLSSLLAVLCLFASAETIELWRGEPIRDASIKRIHEGYLYYEVGGTQRNVRLTEVKSIQDDAMLQAAPQAAQVVTFRDFTRQNRDGKLLGVSVRTEAARIHEPLVRLYAMEQDERGQRQVKLYQNHRNVRDPSRLEGVPVIASEAFRSRYFFADIANLVAMRVEIWVDGELLQAHGEPRPGIEAGWWRTAERLRIAVFQEVAQTEVELPVAAEAEAEAGSPVRCYITRATISPKLGGNQEAAFSFAYMIESPTLDAAGLPEVHLAMVLLGRDNRQSVRQVSIENRAGEQVNLSDGRRVLRELSYELPAGVAINSANLRLNPDVRSALVAWRVEVLYEKKVLAVKMGGDNRVIASLPEEWWK